ncbi:hypothetical protein BDW59DRAFT_169873 [Aspergillus cavernicola]|uniref:Septin-type G domain-containing protein n=1 Tax=Aspergillus cavernicola TaxID=176166 RepID=A0ABR4ITR8_9EURO
MATTAARPRTPARGQPPTDAPPIPTENGYSQVKDQRRTSSSLGFLRRSKSTEPIGGKSKKKMSKAQMEEELRRQREAWPKQPPRLPDLSPPPILETFGGDEHQDRVADLVSPLSPSHLHQSRSAMSTPVPPDSSDPYARTESMTHRGRYSYASSYVSTVNNPRRLRRRKDPTPYNILVIGARNSGKTSFLHFLRKSLALPPHKHPSRSPDEVEYDRQNPANEGYTSHYLETEIDGERVGLTLWDSQGLEKNIVDIQLRGVTGFLESKFEETLNEEMKVIRSPGARDTHIHCTFLILDPSRLDENLAAAERAAQGTPRPSDSRTLGVLDENLDIQVLHTVIGKTTVVPVISKADTITTAHMAYLRKAVWGSLKKANIDPLEILTLEDQEDYTSSESDDDDEARDIAEEDQKDQVSGATSTRESTQPTSPGSPSQRSESTRKSAGSQAAVPHLPFSILSPDRYSMENENGPVGRKFPWGFADPYDPGHCDFLKLKDSVFTDWRSELREASRVIWYERWRTSRLNSHDAVTSTKQQAFGGRTGPNFGSGSVSPSLSMSLQVNDPRSRGRSRSPSGRTRERSTSRDPRLPSPGPEPSRKSKYLSTEPSDEKLRARSRSRGASPLRGHRKSSRYDSDSEHDEKERDSYARSRTDRDHYYQSDSGESRGAAKRGSQRYSQQPQRKSAQLDTYSDEDIYSDSESDDDALAYGDIPGGVERGFYGYKGQANVSGPPSQQPLMTGALGPGTNPRSSAEAVSGQPRYAPQLNSAYSSPPSQTTWAPIPDCERPGFVPATSQGGDQSMPGAFPTATPGQPNPQYMSPDTPRRSYAPWSAQPTTSGAPYTNPISATSHQRSPSGDPKLYANPPAFQYAQIDPNVRYSSKPATATTYNTASSKTESQHGGVRYSTAPQYSTIPTSGQERGPQFVEVAPGSRHTGRPNNLSISTGNSLTVAGPDSGHPPASPMLEPYKGTYQSISPMPSPILIAPRDDDVSDLEPLDNSTDSERRRRRKSKKPKDEGVLREPKSDRSKRGSSRVRHERHDSKDSRDPDSVVLISPSSGRRTVSFYEATEDALALRDALSHARNIDTKTLIQVLPQITSHGMLDLRKEYKNHVKIHGKGVNLAKHIRVKLGNSSFGKVCYATALGRWESEAFWANCYYQSGSSRRELLIESLFGRSNGEMREIKESFKDSRYHDSLEKCMKAELKADKFRTAVLLALEESRQSERDSIDPDLVHRDLQALHAALVSRNGGETAMIYIIVRRSDSHLREVLRAYEKIYQRNFTREMIQKSQNLVGETLAHILNGASNRPMRDALLLHQALRESRSGKERSELLISRLVRLHWEPRHLENVKVEFRRRYGERVAEAIAEEILPSSGGSEWGEFCIKLAQSSKSAAG